MTTARSSRPDEPRPTLARLVELAIVVPTEVGTRLIDAIPAVVDKVPSTAERVKREIVLARFLGKLVVDQGVRELQTRLTPGGPEQPPAVSDPPVAAPVEEIDDPAPEAERAADVPDVTSLALADYDHLSSAQIVGKLEGLDDVERGAIERYEIAGRHRRTILGKLEQLRSAQA
jgi:hypothetical protein